MFNMFVVLLPSIFLIKMNSYVVMNQYIQNVSLWVFIGEIVYMYLCLFYKYYINIIRYDKI